MIILTKKQFENKFLHDALAFKYNLNVKSFGFWRLKLADQWVLGLYAIASIGDRLFFSLCHWARFFFLLSKSKQGIFFQKIAKPPPYIKWTVPYKYSES